MNGCSKKTGCGTWLLILIGVIFAVNYFTSKGQEGGNDYGNNSYQQIENSQSGETQNSQSQGNQNGGTNKVDFSAVPENLRSHIFLAPKGQGGCVDLTGTVKITMILVSNPDSKWTDGDIQKLQTAMASEEKLLEEEAAQYGKNLQVSVEYKNGSYADSIEWGSEPEGWQDSVLDSVGLTTLWKVQDSLEATYKVKEAPIVFAFNTKDRAFARPQKSGTWTEYAIVFGNEASSFRHELFHLFGAKDFYYPDIIEEAANKYLPGSIMGTGSKKDKLDSFNAYMVGWADQLAPEAKQFLTDTISLTDEMLVDANKLELLTGYGTKEVGDGMYTGDLFRGQPHGQGTMIYEDGRKYVGSYEKGTMHGQGTYTWANGDRYTGDWLNGKRTGKGTYTWANGTTYVGDWVEGKRHGQGTYTWNEGSYVGGWSNNTYSGKGTITWSNGQKYVGEFADGKRHGQGIMTYADGRKYVGAFANGSMHGQGTFTWATGSTYTGDWVEGHRKGQGTYTWDEGSYVGGFDNDKYNGFGTMTWSNGQKYVGEFVNGKRHGQGTMTYANGTVKSGTWENGDFVG